MSHNESERRDKNSSVASSSHGVCWITRSENHKIETEQNSIQRISWWGCPWRITWVYRKKYWDWGVKVWGKIGSNILNYRENKKWSLNIEIFWNLSGIKVRTLNLNLKKSMCGNSFFQKLDLVFKIFKNFSKIGKI